MGEGENKSRRFSLSRVSAEVDDGDGCGMKKGCIREVNERRWVYLPHV